jgi:hypothetical protein
MSINLFYESASLVYKAKNLVSLLSCENFVSVLFCFRIFLCKNLHKRFFDLPKFMFSEHELLFRAEYFSLQRSRTLREEARTQNSLEVCQKIYWVPLTAMFFYKKLSKISGFQLTLPAERLYKSP